MGSCGGGGLFITIYIYEIIFWHSTGVNLAIVKVYHGN